MLCGECKKDIAEKLNIFLAAHQERREKAKDVIDQYHIKRK
jgi:tryptophanyl-tRNA synthetase